MKCSYLSKALLVSWVGMVGIVGLTVHNTALAGDNGSKTQKPLHDYLMNRVANKGTYDHAAVKEDKGTNNHGNARLGGTNASATGDSRQTPSTEPMDVNILERLKVSPTITPETTDLLGELIDLNSGSISFKHTDISLPGNSALDVAVRRVEHAGEQPEAEDEGGGVAEPAREQSWCR